MEETTRLIRTFIEIVSLFNNEKLTYCLTGGLAVGIYGIPRATEGIDLIVILKDDGKAKIESILKKAFSKVIIHKDTLDFTYYNIWRNVIVKDEIYSIILNLLICENQFIESILNRKKIITLDNIEIPIISIEDLIILKLLSNRPQDKIDMESLMLSDHTIDTHLIKDIIKSHLLPVRFPQ